MKIATVLFAALLCALLDVEITEAVRRYNNVLACKNDNKLLGMKRLTESDRQRILGVHNKFRNLVASGRQSGQPPAENMLELTWDYYAEKQAFSWASGCVFDHNKPTDKENRPMGQNLYIKMYSLKEDVDKTFNRWVDGMIKGWYDEVKSYQFGSGFSLETGHYTQLVWAKTAKVGCAYSYYQQGMWYVGYLVCNYSPAGNYIGQNPYKIGKVNCKNNELLPSRNYNYLCMKDEYDE